MSSMQAFSSHSHLPTSPAHLPPPHKSLSHILFYNSLRLARAACVTMGWELPTGTWRAHMEQGAHSSRRWGCETVNVLPFWKKSLRISCEVKHIHSLWSGNSTVHLTICSQLCLHLNTCFVCRRIFKVVLFIIAPNWKQSSGPWIGEWVNRL